MWASALTDTGSLPPVPALRPCLSLAYQESSALLTYRSSDARGNSVYSACHGFRGQWMGSPQLIGVLAGGLQGCSYRPIPVKSDHVTLSLEHSMAPTSLLMKSLLFTIAFPKLLGCPLPILQPHLFPSLHPSPLMVQGS